MIDNRRSIEPWFRFGYVMPQPFLDYVAYQFYLLAPRGVLAQIVNLEIAEFTRPAVEAELPRFWRYADELAGHGADRIVLAGVPISAVLGRERALALIAEVRERTGLEGDTDLEAICQAARHLEVERVALATRWAGPLNDAVVAYLRSAGIEVVGRPSSARTMAGSVTLGAADGARLAVELGRAALRAAPTAQALVLPGGRWLSIQAVPVLEAECGRPVLLNLNASIWAALRSAGRGLPLADRGMLLTGT